VFDNFGGDELTIYYYTIYKKKYVKYVKSDSRIFELKSIPVLEEY
jgi:hypothetical protein